MSQTCLTYKENINGTHFDNRQIAIDDLCDQVE